MGSPPKYTPDEIHDVFGGSDSSGKPLTTAEVAEELSCSRETAASTLERLAESGALETKSVGEDTQIWWRPTSQYRGSKAGSRPAFEQAQFQELIETVTDYAIFVLDSEGYVRTWNSGAEQIKGYDEAEIIGEHFSTFYTDEDQEAGRPERNLRKATEQGRIEDEGKRVRKDGSTFWANVTITALRDENEEIQGYIKITRDMTERHQYERRLQQEKERFETLVREVKDYAIFLLDADGIVQTWNEGAKRLKGYEEEEIVGEHFSTFYPAEDRAEGRPRKNLKAAAERGRVEDEGKRVRKDGSTFWANVIITALYDSDGDIRGYAKVTRDMTERHQYEQTIKRERERLEFMNRIVRHNVLNGLNLVNARSQLLQSSLGDDHDVQDHLETIRTRVHDLASLINTMRKFMDAVVSDATHETEPVAIHSELEAKIDLARDSHPDAEFVAHDLPDPSTRVIADELIREVFENVFSNAVVHNDKETPRVEVWASEAVREVPVDSDTGEILLDQTTDLSGDDVDIREWPTLTIHVADNGPGIPDEDKEAILEKGVSELQEPGNGFGLYLVKEMMSAYGGTVGVRDPAGADQDGVVFELVFLRATDE